MDSILKSHPQYLYREHINGILNFVDNRLQDLNLELETISKEDIIKLMRLIVISHDFGKCTSFFQRYIRDSNDVDNNSLKNHSLISAFFCYELINCCVEFENTIFPYVGAFVCKKHHGNLDDFSKTLCTDNYQKDTLLKQIEDIKINNFNTKDEYLDFFQQSNFNIDFEQILDNTEKKINQSPDKLDFNLSILIKKNSSFELFFLIEFLYSLLIDGDKKHASGLLENDLDNKTELDEDLVEQYINNSDFAKSKINYLKNDFFKTCTRNENLNISNKIYSITAPTGIGKTFTSFATALKLKNQLGINYKIHYILPFTSVIDQNYNELYYVLKTKNDFHKREQDYILKHHHLTEYQQLNKLDRNGERYDSESYNNDLLLINSWDSQIVVSTYVQLMHTILGGKSSFMNKFHNICNSVIILDEVQSIALKYWELTRKIFLELSEKFGIYFIFLTATQPLIFRKEEKEIMELGNPEKFFNEEEFNRIKVEDRTQEEIEIDSFYEKFKEEFENNKKNRYLIILNTKKSSYELYERFKKDKHIFGEHKLIYLSTNLTPSDREKKISQLTGKKNKNKWIIHPLKKYIVITTQLIEAGVDISSDVCYRDFAPIDSLVQSAGRCNRFNELKEINKKGDFKIVNLIEYKDDYKNDFSNIYKKILRDKSKNIVSDYLKKDFNILEITNKYFQELEGIEHSEELEKRILNLDFDYIIKNFKFIESFPQREVFILNENSKEIFNDFKNLLNKNYTNKWQKNSDLKKIKNRMKNHSINITFKKEEEINDLFDSIGENFIYLDMYKLREEDKNKMIYNSETGFNLNYDAFEF